MTDGRRTVLVADADPDVRALARLTLDGEAYRVVEAADTETALRTVAAERPEVIVLADDLPGAGGVAITRSVKAQPETRDARVVLVVDRGRPVDRAAADAAGVAAVVGRPVTALGLFRAVDELA